MIDNKQLRQLIDMVNKGETVEVYYNGSYSLIELRKKIPFNIKMSVAGDYITLKKG